MEVELAEDARLRLTFDDEEALHEFAERARSESGFVVSLPRGLELYRRLEVELLVAATTRGSFAAEVAQVFVGDSGDSRTAFLIDPAALRIGPTAGSGEMDGSSPVFDIKRLNVSQKARLATRAGRAERQILLRESSPQVLQGLLVNPRVDAKEILQIVKSTHANGAILQRVASDARWGKNAEILATVAKNPKTPAPFATRLIDRLRTSDLRVMAKMQSGMREVIRRAALREYLRRTSNR